MTIPQDILAAVRARGRAESLEDDEADFLYQTVSRLPEGSRIFEIGCQWGRSSVLFALAAKQFNFKTEHCDPWVDGPEVAADWMAAMHKLDYRFTVHHQWSNLVELPPHHEIDFLYIDGNHEFDWVTGDCGKYLHHVPVGGAVAFHDYGRPTLPDVKTVADIEMVAPEWAPVGVVRTLAIWGRV